MSDYSKFAVARAEGSATVGGPTAVVPDNRSGWLTYEKYYGLREKPFALSSDPRFFYHSRPHASAYEDLLGGIRRRESLSVLSGEIGTGKTTLCRAVLQGLDRQTFSAFVWDPFASREDLLKMVLMEFGVISVDDLTSGRLNGASRTELSYLLYEFLGKLAPLQAFAVVVIDEAQNLSLPLLEEIRILSDSDGRERQLQVILVGQPELSDKLLLPELRQVEQRVSVRCNLEPLTREGTAGYVAYRLQVAEATPDRVCFSDDGIDALHTASSGVPRLINRICDRALHHGHLRRAARIDEEIVRQAVIDVGLKTPTAVAVAPPMVSKAEPAAAAAPEALVERVDVWLATMHDDGGRPGEIPSSLDTSRAPEPEFDHTVGVPRTHLERMARRLFKRVWQLMLWAGGLGAAVFAVTFMLAAWDQHMGEAIPPPALPSAPKVSIRPAMQLPKPPADPVPVVSAGGYVIQIALFSTQWRADNLVQTLTANGLPASRAAVRLGGGIRHQIIAGPYATAAQAQVDLGRLRQSGSFEDARVIETAQNLKSTN